MFASSCKPLLARGTRTQHTLCWNLLLHLSVRYLGCSTNDSVVATAVKKKETKISPVKKTNPPTSHPVITVTEANPSTPTGGVKVQSLVVFYINQVLSILWRSGAQFWSGRASIGSDQSAEPFQYRFQYSLSVRRPAGSSGGVAFRQQRWRIRSACYPRGKLERITRCVRNCVTLAIPQAIHSVTSRADVCSVRVCETSLSVLELLLDLGVVSTPATSPENATNSSNKDEANRVDEELSRHSHGVCIDIVARLDIASLHSQIQQQNKNLAFQSVPARRLPARLRRFQARSIFRLYTLSGTAFDGPAAPHIGQILPLLPASNADLPLHFGGSNRLFACARRLLRRSRLRPLTDQ